MSYITRVHRPYQKFAEGSFVYINKLEESKRHFEQETYGIIDSKERGGYFISTKREGGKWYVSGHFQESELTQVDDVELCKELEQDYIDSLDEKTRAHLMKNTKLGELL